MTSWKNWSFSIEEARPGLVFGDLKFCTPKSQVEFESLPGLVNVYITMENHHFSWENQL